MMGFQDAFNPRGLAATTSAPANVSAMPEQDLPPGAGGTYYGGPLANPAAPSPTPAPQSLTTLANGGQNHATAWMSGQPTPTTVAQQKPFSAAQEQDLPPGAEGSYYGGPLANPPRPSPTPNPDLLKRFSFSSSFNY